MKIVFCTLHVRRSSQAVPLAAGCLAAALPVGLCTSISLVDAYPEQSDREILDAILSATPDVIAFPVYVWNRQRIIRLARQLRQSSQSIYLIAGGPEATGDPAGLLSAAPWNALVHGEGEAALTSLLESLADGLPRQPLPGVTLMSEQGPLSAEKMSHSDLDEATSPWLSGVIEPSSSGVLWEVARGCAFSCDYCFEARGQQGVRTLPKQRLKAELELFIDRGVDQVWVLDSTFNYPPERGVELLELLLQVAPDLHYHLEAKADFIDRRTVSLLGKLNCSVQIGLQSVHQQVLRTIHRPIDLEILTEKIHLLEAEGIVYGFDLIYGLPEDSCSGFRESIDKVLKFSPNHIHIFPLAILPGTRLAQQRQKYGIEAQTDPPYELICSANWTTEALQTCRQLAAAIDLFYNTGRAVAFFPVILEALQSCPSDLFEDFFKWAMQQPEADCNSLMQTDDWSAEDAYRMLQGYLSHRLQSANKQHLVSIFLDLLCYHFNYAETLLGEELVPMSEASLAQENAWESPWQRSHKFRLVPFAYEILDLLEMEGMHLEEMTTLFRPVGSVALFMRRQNQVFCESLGEEMLQLLKRSDGSLSPREIFAGSVSQATGEELVQFAVSEGLLHPAGHVPPDAIIMN
jgi:tRNA A37 methylthiotransferase MiaB